MNMGRCLVVCAFTWLLVACGSQDTDTGAAAPLPPKLAKLGNAALCKAYSGLPPGWGQDAHAGMVRLAGGEFDYGSQRGYAEERPMMEAAVEAFWIDRTEVTNAQFAAFVAATGYVTQAESQGAAAVFVMPKAGGQMRPGSWWQLVQGANWRHPEGAGSSIKGRANEPVVNVTLADAQAYANWLGRSLPTEKQWEFAAKAGRSNTQSDSTLRDADGQPQANFWQGLFPVHNSHADGFERRAPVGCFNANDYRLYDMVGNVWEWTLDRFVAHHVEQPNRGSGDQLTDMPLRAGVARNVIKGGSFLCADNYCARARAASRQPEEVDLPASHLGFRTVAQVTP